MIRKIIFYIILSIAFYSCKKHEKNTQLIKNCIGTYFLIDGEYHRVCNRDDFIYRANGDMLHIKYKFVKNEECDPHISNICWEKFEYSGKVIEVSVVN